MTGRYRAPALFALIYLGTGCGDSTAEGSSTGADETPQPIGAELLGFTTAIGIPGCAQGHLYRAREQVQLQCFASDGSFSWENHGTLTAEGESALVDALASVDLEDTALVDEMGFCDGPESESASVTLWIEDDVSVSYSPSCPMQGILELHQVGNTVLTDISECIELDLLASVEPGCRPY